MKGFRKVFWLHLLGWVLFFSFVMVFVSNINRERSLSFFLSIPFLLFAAVYLALFYINENLLLPKLYFKGKHAAYVGVALLLFIGVFFLKPFDRMLFSHRQLSNVQRFEPGMPPPNMQPPAMPPGLTPPQRPRNPNQIDILSLIIFIAVWAGSSVAPIIRQWRNSEKRALQAEADKNAAELSFLKAQINPHFLFNTLNNIYSLTIIKSDHAPEAVLKLSKMLRYVTDEVSSDFVQLKSEVECANNYIELQKLRLSSKVSVEFSVNGNIDGKEIAPLLFMTFIENAFNYGVSNHEPCLIVIRISTQEKKINLFCQNQVMRSAGSDHSGIGISNAKKRLAHLYPEKHLLDISKTGDNFIVDLTVTT